MVYVFLCAMLLLMLIMGISSAMSSYADAQHAQAVIEVARVGQINAMGNLMIIVIVFVGALLVLAALAFGLWLVMRRELARQKAATGPTRGGGGLAISDMVALEMLRQMRGRNNAQLPAPQQYIDDVEEIPMDVRSWLSS